MVSDGRERPGTGRIIASAAGSVGLALLLAACNLRPAGFDPVTEQGHRISRLFVLAMVLSGLVFLLVATLLIYSIIRFRSRPGDDQASQRSGNRRLEIAWIIGPVLLLIFLFVMTIRTMNSVDAHGPGALDIDVIGHQWWWEFSYPDAGVVTANELHVPVGTPLLLRIDGKDVIHSFWVPQFGWKIDAVPGRTNTMSITVETPGTYEGACSEYCGAEHAWMRIRVIAQSHDDFNAWLDQQKQPAVAPSDALAKQGEQVFQSNTCVNCHIIAGSAGHGLIGPNLTHVGSRETIGAGVLDTSAANLATWVHDPQQVKPGVRMPSFSSLSDSDLQALAHYLEGLK